MAMRYLRNVVTLALDTGKCNGCGTCVTVCPHEVFALGAGKASIADRDACMECGACARNCPRTAIAVRAGVGCAAGIMAGRRGGKGAICDCSEDSSCC